MSKKYFIFLLIVIFSSSNSLAQIAPYPAATPGQGQGIVTATSVLTPPPAAAITPPPTAIISTPATVVTAPPGAVVTAPPGTVVATTPGAVVTTPTVVTQPGAPPVTQTVIAQAQSVAPAPQNVVTTQMLIEGPAYSVGNTIDITTKIHDWVGRPSWLLIIRDLDHNQNIPYIYDFEQGENQWLAFTYSRHYLILASTLYFSPYSHDPWRTKKIHNFCHLESRGKIQRNRSISITIKGELRPDTCRFRCYVNYFKGGQFFIDP